MRIELATNQTTCLLFNRQPKDLDDLVRDLELSREEIQHSPLAFLNLLFKMHGSCSEEYREERDLEVCRIEVDTATSGLIRRRIAPTGIVDCESLMRELHAVNAKLLFLDAVMNWELLAGKFIQETYTILSELRAARGLPPFPAPPEQHLRDSLDYHANLSSFRRVQAQTLQKRVQTQLGVLYSLISQRDNKLSMSVAEVSKEIADATRRDSSSMKTIAALGLVFLPGTFIAALFGAGVMALPPPPVAEARAGTAHLVVSRSWWVFFAISAPLTAVTVVVWAAYLRWRSIAERRRAV
ncbi:MAG: hypothetical protein M1839_007855 [Geoglossum umbratile]|nr:MAG: hypothetical protein M1839_007855 [Geoglossum umbratile]